MGIFRQAITDDDGLVDVSYLAMFCVMVAVLSSIFFICVMSAISYWRCIPSAAQIAGATPAQVVVPAMVCAFDPQPIGIAIGAICGGLATALSALGIYMAATRRERNRPVPGPGEQR